MLRLQQTPQSKLEAKKTWYVKKDRKKLMNFDRLKILTESCHYNF